MQFNFGVPPTASKNYNSQANPNVFGTNNQQASPAQVNPFGQQLQHAGPSFSVNTFGSSLSGPSTFPSSITSNGVAGFGLSGASGNALTNPMNPFGQSENAFSSSSFGNSVFGSSSNAQGEPTSQQSSLKNSTTLINSAFGSVPMASPHNSSFAPFGNAPSGFQPGSSSNSSENAFGSGSTVANANTNTPGISGFVSFDPPVFGPSSSNQPSNPTQAFGFGSNSQISNPFSRSAEPSAPQFGFSMPNNASNSSNPSLNTIGLSTSVFGSPAANTTNATAFVSTTSAPYSSNSSHNTNTSVFGQTGSTSSAFSTAFTPAPPFAGSTSSSLAKPDKTPGTGLMTKNAFSKSDSEIVAKDDRVKRFINTSEASIKRDQMKKIRDEKEKTYFATFKQKQLNEARDVVGKCESMCPEFECYDREVSQELHYFEMLKGTENDPVPQVDRNLAVKKYRRSAAGQDPEIFPEDIRPPAVLRKTMDYLTTEILERSDREFSEIYNFIRDRGRAIRKDFKVQNHLKGPECVDVLEKLGRFLVHSDFVLCELPESKYSWKQNRHQLTDTITTLNEIYDDEVHEDHKYENEAEFRAYYILLNIDDVVPTARAQSWHSSIVEHPVVQHAMQLHMLYQNRLVSNFFQQVRSPLTTYLMACILHFTFDNIRREGLKEMMTAIPQKDKPFPITVLSDVLCFDTDEQTVDFCKHYGFEIAEDMVSDESNKFAGVRLGKRDGKSAWIEPVSQLKSKRSAMVAKKTNGMSQVDIIHGKLSPLLKKDVSKIEPFIAFKLPPLPKKQEPEMKPVPPSTAFHFAFNTHPSPQKTEKPPIATNADQPDSKATAPTIVPIVSKTPPTPKIDYSSLVPHIVQDVLEECVRPIIHLLVTERVNLRNQLAQLSVQVAQDVSTEVIDDMVKVVSKDTVHRYMVFNNTLQDCVKVLLENEVAGFLFDVISDELALKFENKWSLKKSLSRWRLITEYNIQKRKEEEERLRRFRQNMREIPLLMPTLSQQRNHFSQLAEPLTITELASRMAAIETFKSLKMDVDAARSPLDIAGSLRCFLTSRRPKWSVLKVLISCEDRTEVFSNWLVQKFTIGDVPSELQNVKSSINLPQRAHSGKSVTEESLLRQFESIAPGSRNLTVNFTTKTTSFFTVHKKDIGDNTVVFLAKSVKIGSNVAAVLENTIRMENSDSLYSGTNVVILGLGSISLNSNFDAYLRKMQNTLCLLPRYCRPLVVILYWREKASEDLKVLQNKILKNLNLEEIKSNGLITEYQIRFLGNVTETDLSKKALERLQSYLPEIFQNTPPDPALCNSCFHELIERRIYPIFAQRLERLSQTVALGPTVIRDTISGIIQLFNFLIDSYTDYIISDVQKTTWPAAEVKRYLTQKTPFSKFPPMNWNSDKHLQHLKILCSKYKLPAFSGASEVVFDEKSAVLAFKTYLQSIPNDALEVWIHNFLTEFNLAVSKSKSIRIVAKVFETLVAVQLTSLRDEIDTQAYGLESELTRFEQEYEAKSFAVTNEILNRRRIDVSVRKRERDYSTDDVKRYRHEQPPRKPNVVENAETAVDAYAKSVSEELERSRGFRQLLQSALQHRPE